MIKVEMERAEEGSRPGVGFDSNGDVYAVTKVLRIHILVNEARLADIIPHELFALTLCPVILAPVLLAVQFVVRANHLQLGRKKA
jgi:hypothetical protein